VITLTIEIENKKYLAAFKFYLKTSKENEQNLMTEI